MGTSDESDVIVIGAGMAGVAAARHLVAAGQRVLLLDKGHRPGGRMATRNSAGATFDHGAQFLTVADPAFDAEIRGLVTAGVVRPWFPGSPDAGAAHDAGDRADAHVRYCGTRGMRPVVEHLARDLDVRTSTRVATLGADGGRWVVRTDDGTVAAAASVIATPPVAQTTALLRSAGDRHADALTDIERLAPYAPCIAVLVVPTTPLNLPPRGALRWPGDAEIEWVADNRAKGISSSPALTVHLGAAASVRWWDADDTAVTNWAVARLSARGVLGAATPVRVHRWRYSRPAAPPPGDGASLTAVDEPRLLLAGDAFAGGRVEGAYRSGVDAARRLLAR